MQFAYFKLNFLVLKEDEITYFTRLQTLDQA